MPIPIVLSAIDWVELIFFLIIVGSTLVGKLMQANHQRAMRKKRPNAQPPVPDPRQGPPRPRAQLEPPVRRAPAAGNPAAGKPAAGNPMAGKPAAGNLQGRLEHEIEAFLRKATGDRAPGKAMPPKTRTVAAQPPPRPIKREALHREFPTSESVSDHVQRHIRSGGIAERDAQLGDELERADERIEDHLHDVFDHKLGNLSTTEHRTISQGTDAKVWENAGGQSSPMAAKLFEMLSSPQQVGAAIVLSEIIRRPSMQWDDE